MSNDKIDNLFKTQDKIIPSIDNNSKYLKTKRSIKNICKALSLETKDYNPAKSVENVKNYIRSENKLERILYSEISNYVFSLEMYKRGIFATNVEKLLLFSLDENNNVDADVEKIVVKIYDHFQLILYQIENTNNIFANSIEDAKNNLQKEIKGIEKEYISILGIFASIVLTFVGGITFSTSVLQNMSNTSVYRLLIVIDFLAFVLFNVVYILVKFVFTINNKDAKLFNIRKINISCIVIAFVVAFCWLLNVDQLQEFITFFLPWTK